MANIFKTTLKKDVISDIENNNLREIRFPITKFWATRLAEVYDIDEKIFEFKIFDSLELSSPSNKETNSEIYVFDFIKTFVDGEEFVIEFASNDDVKQSIVIENNIQENIKEDDIEKIIDVENDGVVENDVENDGESDCELEYIDDGVPFVDISDVFAAVMDWFNGESILDNFYKNDSVFATNASQIIIMPNGKVLGLKKSLPVNNDVEIRVEFNMNKKIYFDETLDINAFEEEILKTLSELKKNNFVFVWKRYTGIFMNDNGQIYFGIKYSTRKSIGFKHRYNVQ